MEQPGKRRGNRLLKWASVLLLAAVAVLIWLFIGKLEGNPPELSLDRPSPVYLGPSTELVFTVSDPRSGLRRLQVILQKDAKENVLADIDFTAAGLKRGEKVPSETVRVKFDPRAAGISDGPARLQARAWDNSWRNWLNGNLAELNREVVIDTRPPVIENLIPQNTVSQGGAGLAVYRLSESCPESGLRVGDTFFPGYSGYYPDPAVHIAFFAMSYLSNSAVAISIEAQDQAGNRSRTPFPYHFRKTKFRKDTLQVSDEFISKILPGLQAQLPAKADASLKEKFLFINRELRKENYQQIVAATDKTEAAMLWKGAFLRLPNSAPRAGFADHRTYKYAGKEIDQQDHLGVDLASIAKSPVPAANSGVVVRTGFLGIYGNTVILDHGFGLFSMYSHLSQISVKPGDRVTQNDVLGRTGSTGLAGGDHLHFSMLVQHTFVDPVEWWDAHWIKDNITAKLNSIKK